MFRALIRIRLLLALASVATLISTGCGGCGSPDNNGVSENCSTAADCAAGERCNADGLCTTESDSCEFKSDCGIDEYCADGTCASASCEADEDCASGAICENSTCRSGCRTSDDCPDGQSCTATNVCAQEGCTTNSCPDFQTCNEDADPPACEYTGDCTSDVQCVAYAQQLDDGEDYICSTAEQKCVIKPPCGSDTDCKVTEICEPRSTDGRLVCRRGCRTNDACRTGQICDLNQLSCTEGCDTVDDCPNDDNTYACVDLVCVPTCDTRNDCLMGQICKGSPRTCQACSQNADCPATDVCDFTQGISDEEKMNPLLGLCVPAAPTCPDDSFGENHDQNTPYTIATLPFATDATDQPLFCQENAGGEWFEFDAAAGDVIEIELVYDNSVGNLDIGLRRPQGDEIVASAQSPAVDGGREVIRFGVDLGGTFLVQVRGSITDDNTAYALSVDAGPPGACTDDPLEENDDRASASTLDPMTDYQDLEVCGSDADFYKLVIAENQVVRITAEAPVSLGNIDLILWDSSMTQVAAAQTRRDVEEIEIALDDAGDYILEVRVVSGVGNIEYDLMWSQRDNNCADPYEVNDTCPAATIAPGTYPGLNVCDDSDWYSISLLPLQTVTITATYDRAVSAGDLDITLFGPSDCATLVADGTETTVSGTVVQEQMQFQAMQGGVFNLQTFLFSGIQAQYELDIDVSDGPPCTDDFAEPNNDAAAATGISRANAASGADNVITGLKMCDTDEDWFEIDLIAGDEIQFDVKFANALGDLDVELIGPGNIVIDSATSGSDDETVSHTVGANEAGTYYLRVFPKMAARNDYWVLTTLNGVGPADPDCPDDYENNDTRMEAAALTNGTYGLLVCGNPDDDDWFSADLEAGETITIDLSFAHATGNIDLFLFDDSGSASPVAQGRTTTDDESVSYTTARDQTVFWRVEAVSNVAAQPYDMTVAVTAAPACVDDSFSPNASSGAAASVEAPGLYPRLQLCDGVDDWYQVELTAGDASEVFVNFDGSRADLDVFVYVAGALANPIGMGGTSTTSDESVTFTPSSTGTYLIQVVGKNDARLPYDLLLYTDVDGDGVPDGPEDRVCPDPFENNDTSTTAAQIPAGSYDALLICTADNDYYRVFVPAGATLTATADFDNDLGNIDIRITNMLGTELDSSRTMADTETVSWTNPGMGANVIVHVSPATNGFSNYYSLDVSLAFADACTDDSVAGDTQGSAGSVSTGAYELTLCEGTDDWFNLGSITSVDARLEFKTQLGDLDMQLIDSNGVVVETVGTDNTEVLAQSGLSGQHWLRVFPKNDAFVRNDYDLWLSLNGATPSAPYCPDRFERNDDVVSASTITVPQTPQLADLNACGADQDWYLTQDLSGISHDIAVFYDHGTGSDVAVSIWDADDDPLVDAPLLEIDTAEDDAVAKWTPPSVGQYYVLVENEAGSAVSTPYDLLFARSSVYTTQCPEDSFEQNGNPGTARTLGFPVAQALAVCPSVTNRSDESDYFKFTPPSSGPVTVELRFDATQMNLDFQLFDGFTSLGGSADDSGNRESFTFNATAGKTYTVFIYPALLNNQVEHGPYFLRID